MSELTWNHPSRHCSTLQATNQYTWLQYKTLIRNVVLESEHSGQHGCVRNGRKLYRRKTYVVFKRAAFWGFRWYCCPFRGSNPQNPDLGAQIGVFKPNERKIQTHISKLLLATKFDTVIKYPSWWPNKSQMADGRRLEKFTNYDISKTVSPILTKFGTVMKLGTPKRTCQ